MSTFNERRSLVDRVRQTSGLLLIAVVTAACASDTPTEAPSRPAASRPAATPLGSASPSVEATPESSSPSAPATPAAAERTDPSSASARTLKVKWNRQDLTGIGAVESIDGVAKTTAGYVLLAELSYVDEGSPDSAVWWSADATSWRMAQEFPAGIRNLTLTAGGPGFVVAGAGESDATVWTSSDGRTWQAVNDPSLHNGVMSRLVATDSGLVGFGWQYGGNDQRIWTSSDGVEWLAATNETGVRVARGLEAVGSDGHRAIAFVSEGEDRPPSIWETSGRADWTRTGRLKDVATIDRVAAGARGWVALGDNRAWTSTDGRSWSKAVPGPDVDSDVIVDDAGYVAVGYVGSLPGETCGDQRPFAGHTWTSADGRRWERMKVTKEFRSAMVTKLLVVDRTLVGFGQRTKGYDGYGLPVALWTESLPPISTPSDASDEASVFQSCGG